MPSDFFARDDEKIMRLLQEWPDILEIMGVKRERPAGTETGKPRAAEPDPD